MKTTKSSEACGAGVPPAVSQSALSNPLEGIGQAGGTPTPQFAFLDPRETPFVEPRSRGFLPHLYKECGTYFVTFRLWDAVVPKDERKKAGAVGAKRRAGGTPTPHAQAAGGTPTPHAQGAGGTPAPQKQGQERRPKTREEVAADSEPPLRLGSCALANPAIAEMVQNALKHFHGERYYLHAWCVMPNHVHVVYTALPGHSPEDIHHSWNSYTAHQANKILKRSGTFWEAEGFDHLIRSLDDLEWFIAYTENNPVTAGLCRNRNDWRWSSAGSRWNPRAACGAGVPPAGGAQENNAAETAASQESCGVGVPPACFGEKGVAGETPTPQGRAGGTPTPQTLVGETPALQVWNERTFLQVQAVQLRELLRMSGDDPILVPQLAQRLSDVEEKLGALGPSVGMRAGVVAFAARGVFRGLTRESRIFDFVAENAKLLTGTIAASLGEQDLDRIAALTNQRCVASLQKATFFQGGLWQESYLLLNAEGDHEGQRIDGASGLAMHAGETPTPEGRAGGTPTPQDQPGGTPAPQDRNH